MARLPYVDPPGEIADQIRARRDGDLRPLDRVLLHSPDLAAGWNHLLGAVRQRSTLPDDVRELVILRVAVLNRADYEWDAHAPIAVRAGMDDAQLAWVRDAVGDSPLDEQQQLAYDVADALTTTCRVPDELFKRARAHFGDRATVELVATASAYNMVSRFLTALDVDERLERE